MLIIKMLERCNKMKQTNELLIPDYRIKHLSYFVKQSHKNLLDISCGETKYLQYWRWKGLSVAGTEYDDNKITYCNSIGIPCDKLDLDDPDAKIDYDDNSFDVVTATEVLEHLKYPKLVVSEMLRVSKDLVLITVPVFRSYWSDEHINIWQTADRLIHDLVDIKHKDEVEIACDVIVTKPEDWAINQRSFILALYKK